MIQAVDSSGFHPTLAQVQAAYAQGIRAWGKYLPGPGIYSGDTKADFDTLKAGGMVTLAFWSGAADPAQMKALGAAWGVDHICLDVESRIRGDGAWVQPALNVAGGGLYGSPSVFTGRTAEFFMEAYYAGVYPSYIDPQSTWRGPAPSIPHGIQWAGSVSAFGGAVDRSWLDDWFGGATPQGDNVNLIEKKSWIRLAYMASMGREPETVPMLDGWANSISDDASNLEAVLVKILDSTESVAYRAAVKQAGPTGPQGPPGAKGDPGAAVVTPGTTITSTVQ